MDLEQYPKIWKRDKKDWKSEEESRRSRPQIIKINKRTEISPWDIPSETEYISTGGKNKNNHGLERPPPNPKILHANKTILNDNEYLNCTWKRRDLLLAWMPLFSKNWINAVSDQEERFTNEK